MKEKSQKKLEKLWYVKNTEYQIGMKNKECMSFIIYRNK